MKLVKHVEMEEIPIALLVNQTTYSIKTNVYYHVVSVLISTISIMSV